MASYTVGLVASLVRGPGRDTVDAGDDLFTADRKQEDRPRGEVAPKARKNKRGKDSGVGDGAAGAVKEDGGKGKKRARKAVEVDEEAAVERDENESVRHLSARYEDKKSRVEDAAADARTVFVGNLKWDTKPRRLRGLFRAFGTVESVRLRGAARPDPATSKRVAVIKRKFNENRTNINAYVKFAKPEEARASCKLNGTEVNGYVIRVDMADSKKVVNGGAQQPQHDSRRAVFLGNLDFSLEENALQKHFSRCGDIVGVRLVRDSGSGMGKGFGYVNFGSEDAVELALKLDGSELQGRPIRIQRCVKKMKKKPLKLAGIPSRSPKHGNSTSADENRSKGLGKAKQKSAGVKHKHGGEKPMKQHSKPAFQGKASDETRPKKKVKNKSERKKNAIAKKLQS